MFLFVASNIQAKENTHNHHQQHNMSMVSSPLTEAGNDVFELFKKLYQNSTLIQLLTGAMLILKRFDRI
ncbi:MAG: hypothetical protein ACJAS9_002075 [Polaribacter sp.]|jgi:hypothetical protein